jgi:hypothetical protein
MWGNDRPRGVLAMARYRGSDWGENGAANLLLGEVIVVLATIIYER